MEIIYGDKSRFSNSMQELLKSKGINFKVSDTPDEVEFILRNKTQSSSTPINVFYARGRSRNNSSKEICDIDSTKLKIFLAMLARNRFRGTLVYISSGGSVYGANPGKVDETSPLQPATHYAEMKVNHEIDVKSISSNFGFGAKIFRIANAYGLDRNLQEGQDLIGGLMKNSRLGVATILRVDTTSAKQYALYSEYCAGIVECMNSVQKLPTILNLAPQFQYSIGEILSLIEKYKDENIYRKIIQQGNKHIENVYLESLYIKNFKMFSAASLETYIRSQDFHERK